MPEKDLRIVIADPNPLRAAILRDGLAEAGYAQITSSIPFSISNAACVEIDADIVLIDLENPNRDVLEQMIRVSGVQCAPGRDVRGQFRTPP